jgi:hypothetical protein
MFMKLKFMVGRNWRYVGTESFNTDNSANVWTRIESNSTTGNNAKPFRIAMSLKSFFWVNSIATCQNYSNETETGIAQSV